MITLSPSQQFVVDEFPTFLLNDDTEMTISGFAGSGKSFLVEYLADMGAKQQELVKLIDPSIQPRKLHFSATTNKAAAVLRSFLNRDAKTIHSLLGLTVNNNYRTGAQTLKFSGNGENLEQSIVFIDEASMINAQLLKAIRGVAKEYRDCKLVFIGDAYQLPPVKEDVCPVFNNSPNTFFLKEIQRQAQDNPIIQLSAEYRAMLEDHTIPWPTIKGDGKHIIFHEEKAPFFAEIKAAYQQPHEPDDLKIVAWSNKRVRGYNTWVRSLLGCTGQFQVGDLVTTNKPIFADRSIIAKTDTVHRIAAVSPATKGSIHGFNIQLRNKPGQYFQPEDWDLVQPVLKSLAAAKAWSDFYSIKEGWADLRPVHASTVHKAQGSTYRKVFVDLNNIGQNTKWREVVRLVYVAITRASETVHIYGNLGLNYKKLEAVDLMKEFRNADRVS